jgi:hypothetical protein
MYVSSFKRFQISDIILKADKIWHVLQNANVTHFGGMLPTNWVIDTGKPGDGE